MIIVDQFDLGGGIGSDIHALNVMENTNKLVGVLVILTVPTGSFAELLYGVVLENRQPGLVWRGIATNHPGEPPGLSRLGR